MKTKLLSFILILLPLFGHSELKFDTLDCGPKTARALLQLQKGAQQQKTQGDTLVKLLEKHVVKEDFYSDLLSTANNFYLLIISLLVAIIAGGILWRSVILERKMRGQDKEFRKVISETKKEFEKIKNEIDFHRVRHDVNYCKGRMLSCHGTGNQLGTFLWGIRLLSNAYDYKEFEMAKGNINEEIETTLTYLTASVIDLGKGADLAKPHITEISECFESILKKEKSEERKTKVIKFREEFFKVCYSEKN